MASLDFYRLCNEIADEIAQLLPDILQDPKEFNNSQGNCVLCIMNAKGDSFARMYGDNPARQRQTALIAWKKAHQVWVTGYATGEYETLVYTHQIDDEIFGIPRPELIGWYGGIEAKTHDGERLVLAFSGVSGEHDVGLIRMAAQRLKSFSF